MFSAIASLIFAFHIGILAKKACKNQLYTASTPAPPSCPTDSTWRLSTNYDNRARCIGLQLIPSNLTDPTQLVAVCQTKNANALPASLHNTNELAFCKNYSMNGGLNGLYLPSGKAFAAANFKNLDGMTVDFLPFNTSGGTTSTNSFALVSPNLSPSAFVPYIAPGKANVICAMWAS